MKRALVTGGSGGIGAAICQRLAADGHHVVVHANRQLDKAQAMAVHGALVAGTEAVPRQGYLTSVRGVTLHAERLDDLPGPLDVRAERLSGDASNVLYRFSVGHAGRCLLEGRARSI